MDQITLTETLSAGQNYEARLRARWVYPVSSPPIEHATVVIQQGIITEIHQLDDPAALDLGNVGLLPALVNTHAHLEFSHLPQPFQPAHPFAGWIQSLMAERRGRTHPPEHALARGMTEAVASGTGTMGEIVTANHPSGHYAHPGLRTVAFREVIAPVAGLVAGQVEVARDWVAAESYADFVRGLSPHATYSVHPQLLQEVAALASAHHAAGKTLPVAMHLAETPEEMELLAHGTGELADLFRRVGAWEPGLFPGWGVADCLRTLESCPRVLVVHGNYLATEDQAWLADRENFSVVYCPRTHAFFGHRPHPWRELAAQGIRVALGTDGRSSNPDLSLWREVQFLRQRFPEVNPAQLLKLATQNGAEALGVSQFCGTLEIGKRAGFAVADFRATSSGNEPYGLLYGAQFRCATDLRKSHIAHSENQPQMNTD